MHMEHGNRNQTGSVIFYPFIRRALIFCAACLVFCSCPLSGQGLFSDTTNSLTAAPRREKQAPLTSLLDFGLSVGSFQSEASGFSGFDPDRNPSNAFRFLELGYTRFLKHGLGFKLSLIREEEAGWMASALGVWRKEATGNPVGGSALELSAGVRVVKSPPYHDVPVVLFAWGVFWGDEFKHFLSLDVDGFFFVPWSPGFLLSNDSRFKLMGQLRLGTLGLEGKLGLLNRRQTASENVRIIEARGGILFFRKMKWKLAFRFTLQQKALLVGSGAANTLQAYRNAFFLGTAVTGKYRDTSGRIYRYSWGVDFLGHQEQFQTGFSDPVWSSDTMEVSFFFRGSLSL